MTRLSNNPVANTNTGIKIEIRRRVLAQLIGKPRVLDCFAGPGEMWRAVYRGHKYLGLDTKEISDERQMVCVDNREFLREADLPSWNVFDLDAYSDPWEQFLIICSRRKIKTDEMVAVFVTDCLDVAAKNSGKSLSRAIKLTVGIPGDGDRESGWMRIPCLNRHLTHIRDLLVRQGVDAMRARIVESWRGNTGKGGVCTFYGGLLLESRT